MSRCTVPWMGKGNWCRTTPIHRWIGSYSIDDLQAVPNRAVWPHKGPNVRASQYFQPDAPHSSPPMITVSWEHPDGNAYESIERIQQSF